MQSRMTGLFVSTMLLAAGCDLNGILSEIGKKTDGGTPSDGGSTVECNQVVNSGPVVSKTSNAGPTPAPTGGTITDGTYVLTRMDKYNGIQGSGTHQETWVFVGNNVQVVTNNEFDGGAAKRYAATWSTSGTSLVFNLVCPEMQTMTFPYSVNGSELVMVNADDANETHTFTKQ